MKTHEELNVLKEELEFVNRKLPALTEEELEQVTGGNIEQEIKNLARQHLQLERESLDDDVKNFLEKYARFYGGILPKK